MVDLSRWLVLETLIITIRRKTIMIQKKVTLSQRIFNFLVRLPHRLFVVPFSHFLIKSILRWRENYVPGNQKIGLPETFEPDRLIQKSKQIRTEQKPFKKNQQIENEATGQKWETGLPPPGKPEMAAAWALINIHITAGHQFHACPLHAILDIKRNWNTFTA